MHMYVTSALQKTDMKAVMLQLAMDLHHKKVERERVYKGKKERERHTVGVDMLQLHRKRERER